jgi:hypothetical protein
MTWIGAAGAKTENTSPANRKEKPQRGVPMLAQGKSAPSGRSPGFRFRDLASAECLSSVQNSRRYGRNRANSVSASAMPLRYTKRTARPMKIEHFDPGLRPSSLSLTWPCPGLT